MENDLRQLLKIPYERLDAINDVLLDPNSRAVQDFMAGIEKYGSPAEINARASSARQLPVVLEKVKATRPEYLKDLEWLQTQREAGAFISIPEYRRKVLGAKADTTRFKDEFAVTLEVSALQYFPWVRLAAERAIEQGSLMPGRFIKVRKMQEQERDGDLPAIAAAMQIIGASYVETLDTKGTDGSNIHLGGPATITGYFGGVGQPNHYPLKWLDEFLYYYTTYGVRQVLNINSGTVLVGYLLYRLGIDIEFKISVFMGNDNPYSVLWTLIGAKLFSRDDGTCPLIGFNLSNSVDNRTIEITAEIRHALGFGDVVRIEHHITETWKSIVVQPYDRRTELVALADHVPNISAKHEGGDPDEDSSRAHPSDILDYFRAKEEIEAAGDLPALLRNYLDKHNAVNRTARALTEHGLSFVAAPKLHHDG
jgi:hypothetical protein